MIHDYVILWQQQILDDVIASLDEEGTPVGRSFLAPGAIAPWDDCCDDHSVEGQAWVAVTRVYPSTSFPIEDTSGQFCDPKGWAADLTVGVLRCAHTIDDDGNIPTAQQVTDDAWKVAHDRAAVRRAILCGVGEQLELFRIGQWLPQGPQGGCVGGTWTVTLGLPSGLGETS